MSEVEYEIDWEIPPGFLAGIFVSLNWQYDIPDVGIVHPNPEVLQAMIEGLHEVVHNQETGSFATLGRIMVLRDPETPNSYDFYVKAGHLSPVIADEQAA